MSSLLSPDAIAVLGAIVNCPKRHINGFKIINSWARALVKDSGYWVLGAILLGENVFFLSLPGSHLDMTMTRLIKYILTH
jgi:hypothetical protein